VEFRGKTIFWGLHDSNFSIKQRSYRNFPSRIIIESAQRLRLQRFVLVGFEQIADEMMRRAFGIAFENFRRRVRFESGLVRGKEEAARARRHIADAFARFSRRSTVLPDLLTSYRIYSGFTNGA